MSEPSIRSPLRLSGAGTQLREFRLDCAMLTAPGRGRARNEDQCVFAAPGDPAAERAGIGYLFAVVGGNAHGGNGLRAARETAASIREILDDERAARLRPDLLSHYLQAANGRLHDLIRGRATVSAVWIWEEPGAGGLQAAWAHVGDTRLYRQREGRWTQVTRDHALGRLLDRAVGGSVALQIDTGRFVPRPGERLVLLSDGVWRGARPGNALGGRMPGTAEAARQLVGQARLNGGADDTSAIVVTVRRAGDPPEPEH
jgi:serine/threonine protein phosphatase PrpC